MLDSLSLLSAQSSQFISELCKLQYKLKNNIKHSDGLPEKANTLICKYVYIYVYSNTLVTQISTKNVSK